MQAKAQIQVQPVGTGASNRAEVERAITMLREAGLEPEAHDLSSEVEGELSHILATVERIHEQLHEQGTPRITTTVSVHTRVE